MQQAELQPRRYTPAEYFALEERSEVRHEYFEGEVFAMAGGTKMHNLISAKCSNANPGFSAWQGLPSICK